MVSKLQMKKYYSSKYPFSIYNCPSAIKDLPCKIKFYLFYNSLQLL